MRNLIRVAAAALVVSGAVTVNAAEFDAKKFTQYELPNSTLHLYQSGDPMGDVSFIVEGKKSLVVVEQPTFYSAIKEFQAYTAELKKPVDRVVANYHSGGAAQYPTKRIMMPETMAQFGDSKMAQGMIAKFTKAFGEAADFRPVKGFKTFTLPMNMKLAGVEFDFTPTKTLGMPGAVIQIDGDALYTHFSPAKAHANPMQIKSMESVDAALAEMNFIKASGAKYIFGSHGQAATQTEVEFQIEYLELIKKLRKECTAADLFGQRVLLAHPYIPNVEAIKAVAKALYPDEKPCPVKEEVRARMQDYFDMVSNLDFDIAKSLWADGDVSIIAPRGHFFGAESIANDFLKRSFSSFQSRKLSSLSEVINIYGESSANVQLYWKFDTKDAKGVEHSGRGRETLIFEKIEGVWKLVHVHYSRMPEAK